LKKHFSQKWTKLEKATDLPRQPDRQTDSYRRFTVSNIDRFLGYAEGKYKLLHFYFPPKISTFFLKKGKYLRLVEISHLLIPSPI